MLEFLSDNLVARLAFLLVVFALTVFIILSAAQALYQRFSVQASVASISRPKDANKSDETLRDRKDTAWSQLAESIENAGLNLSDSNVDSLRDKLRAAGYKSPSAPKIFTLIRLILVIVFPAIYLFSRIGSDEQALSVQSYFVCGLYAVLGLYLPNLFISARASRRREEIVNGFPDCLDLTLVAVEAGLGLEAALDRVGREMVESHPLVADMLSKTTLQLRAGAERSDAFRKLGEESGVDEIRSFSTLIIQSDKLGTSIADTLRIYSAEMREKRRMRAEEKAHRLPVLISIPLVLNMLPTMIGVLMLPGVVRIVRDLIPSLGGAG